MGGLTTQTSDTSKLAVQGGDSNIGIIQVHAGGGENVGDLSGITFSHGTDDLTSRAKAAVAFRANGSGNGRGDLCFYVDGASDNLQVSAADEKLRIKGNGEVGIGTDDPDCKLHVMKGSAGTIDSDGNSVLTLENSNHCVLQMLSPADKSSYIMFGDPADANVGQIRYDHDNDAMIFDVNVNPRMTIDSNGNIGAPSGTNIFNASDERLKKNIVSLDKGLTSINSLRPVSFNWIDGFCDEEKQTLYGFIAQEVKAIVDESKTTFSAWQIDENNKKQQLQYAMFVVPLVKAVQELSAKVTELESKLGE